MPCYDAFHSFVCLVFIYTEHEGSEKEEVVFQSGYRIASTSSTLLMLWVRPWQYCLYHFRMVANFQYVVQTDSKL